MPSVAPASTSSTRLPAGTSGSAPCRTSTERKPSRAAAAAVSRAWLLCGARLLGASAVLRPRPAVRARLLEIGGGRRRHHVHPGPDRRADRRRLRQLARGGPADARPPRYPVPVRADARPALQYPAGARRRVPPATCVAGPLRRPRILPPDRARQARTGRLRLV